MVEENYKKEQPTVGYMNDFVFGKDVHVQGELLIGNTFKTIEPKQFNDRKSNGFYVAQLPADYLEKCKGTIHMVEAQLTAVHEGGSHESCDGAGQNVWLVLFTVPNDQIDGRVARPQEAHYIATSKNCINYSMEAWGNDYLVQFQFDDFDYDMDRDGIIRVGVFNETLVGHAPSHTEQDIVDIVPGRAGREPVRFRRAAYSILDNGSPNVPEMERNGVRFWSGVKPYPNCENQPYTPSQSTGPDGVYGMPLFRVYTRSQSNDVFSANRRFQEQDEVLKLFLSWKDDLAEIIKDWRSRH